MAEDGNGKPVGSRWGQEAGGVRAHLVNSGCVEACLELDCRHGQTFAN